MNVTTVFARLHRVPPVVSAGPELFQSRPNVAVEVIALSRTQRVFDQRLLLADYARMLLSIAAIRKFRYAVWQLVAGLPPFGK